MSNSRIKLALCAFLAMQTGAAWADSGKPRELNTDIHAPAAYGQGVLSHLWIRVYEASLWTDAPAWSMEKPFALSVTYAIGIEVDDLVDKTIDEMKRVEPVPENDLAAYARQLRQIYPPVHSGDRITALFKPPAETVFFYNARKMGSVTDAAFARRFFGIWLATTTSRPGLRASLLNLHD